MKYQIFKQKFSEMEGLNLRIREAKQGFLFYAFSTLLIALQFGLYITDSSILGLMDLEGWLFFITSCISSASSSDYPAITGRVSTLLISSRSSSSACRNWDTRYRPILVPPLPTRHSAESSLVGCQAFIPRQKAIRRWSEIQG